MIRARDTQLDLLSATERRPNTARETRLCRRFRLENRLPEHVRTLGALQELELGRDRPFPTPECCERTIPDEKKASADHCTEYCRKVLWDRDHPRLGTSEEERYREAHPEPEPESPAPPSEDGRKRKPTIDERFEAWLEAQPETYQAIRREAYRALHTRQVIGGRRARYGIALIVERLVWLYDIERRSPEPFKINHDFRSRIVRKLIDEDPRFDGFFETRELKTK